MAWLNNLAYWKPMPDAKQCEVYSAARRCHPPFEPGRTVEPVAKLLRAGDAGLPTDVVRNPTGVAFLKSDPYVRTYSVLPGANPNLWVLSRLSDGAVFGAVQFRNWQTCFGYAAFVDSADVAAIVEPSSGMRVARFALDSAKPPTWSPWNGVLPIYTTGFAASTFWGLSTLAGTVAVADWLSGTLAPVDTGSVTFSSAARSDVAVWTTQNGVSKGVVKAYSPTAKNVWTLVDQPVSNTSVVALSPPYLLGDRVRPWLDERKLREFRAMDVRTPGRCDHGRTDESR